MAEVPSPPDQQDPDQPVAASHWEAATAALVALWAQLNASLLADYTRILRETPATPEGEQGLLARLTHVTKAHLAAMTPHLGPALTRMARSAYWDGIEHATHAFRGGGGSGTPHPLAGIMSPIWKTHAEQSVEVIRASLVDDFRIVTAQVLRAPNDVYKTVVAAKAQALVGDTGVTPRMAQAQGYAEFVSKGITGYTDRSGRRWPLGTYTEMAIRTSSMRAYNAAYQAQLKSLGVTLFSVPDDGHPCPLCSPWQGKVLSDQPLDDPQVAGTIEEARAAGLFHPQCKHVLLPYFPGISTLPATTPWDAEKQAAYEATQRLRALERRARQLHEVIRNAAEPAVAQRAKQNLGRTQATIRQHVAKHGLVRRPHRENRAA